MKEYILSFLFIVLLALPVNAQVYPGEFEHSINTGESYEIHFAIFNNRTEPVFFSILLPEESAWELSVNPGSGILNPGNAKDITLKFTAPRASTHNTWVFDIRVETYNNTGLIQSRDVMVTLHVYSRTFNNYLFKIPFPGNWGYWGTFLNVVIFWVITAVALYLALMILKKLVKRTKTKIDDILLGIIHLPLTIWVIAYGIFTSSLVFPLSSNILSMIYLIYNAITIMMITWIIYRVYRRLVIKYAFQYGSRIGKMEGALISALDKVGVFAIVSIGGIMLLKAVGIDITVLLASMGILGIILGFAAQDTIGNFFAGIHILLDRSIDVGDYILLEGDENVYRVRDVGLRSTKLYDIFAHTIIYIPNNIIANHKIINLSRPDSKLKLRIDVGVSYACNVDTVKRALYEVAEENVRVVKDNGHQPVVIFREFGESSLNFILYVWIDNLKDQWRIQSELRDAIVNKFRKMGIEIPFPQVDVHIKR